MTETLIDQAHANMQSAPTDDRMRLTFYARLAESELFLLLESEPHDDMVDPKTFETEDGQFVLAFDREDRLASFVGGSAPYAALSGRNLIAMLVDQEVGIGLNLNVAPSEYLVPPDAVQWLNTTLDHAPRELVETPQSFAPPTNVPEVLIQSLDAKLASAAGLAKYAYLASAKWHGGRQSHLLAFINPIPGSEPALATAIQEAVVFSGIDGDELDVTFLASDDGATAKLAKVGLRFDLPEPPRAEPPKAPGMNPDEPPRLR